MNRQENVPLASSKLMREDQLQTDGDERKRSNSNSTRKLAASSPELRKHGIHHEQDLPVSAEEVGHVSK